MPVKVCTVFLPFSAVGPEMPPFSEPSFEVTQAHLLTVVFFYFYCHFLSAPETN